MMHLLLLPYRCESISTWGRTRTRAPTRSVGRLGESRAFRYTIEMWGRRLDLHQHHPVYKTGALLSRATSALRTAFGPKQERSDSNTVDQDQPAVGARNLVSLPGEHSRNSRPVE